MFLQDNSFLKRPIHRLMSLDGVVGGGLAPHHIIEATVKRGGEPDKFNFHSISSTPVVDNDALCIFFQEIWIQNMELE